MSHAYWAGTCANPDCRATIIIRYIGLVQPGWEKSALRPTWTEGNCEHCQRYHQFSGHELWVSIHPHRLEHSTDQRAS